MAYTNLINKSGTMKNLLEDLQANYAFKNVTDDGKLYISDYVYLQKATSDTNDQLTVYNEKSGISYTLTSSTSEAKTYKYCIAPFDTGIAFGLAYDTISYFIGKTTDSAGNESAGFVGQSISTEGTTNVCTDNTTSDSAIVAPRNDTIKTSAYQIQLAPVMSCSGGEVFNDVYWVLFANQKTTSWKLSDAVLNDEHFLVGKYLAMRYNE